MQGNQEGENSPQELLCSVICDCDKTMVGAAELSSFTNPCWFASCFSVAFHKGDL